MPRIIWRTKRSLLAEKPRLLADENIAAGLVRELRNQGFEVTYIAESQSGLTDPDILALARQHGLCVVTEDRDFGELVFRRQLQTVGIILLRLPVPNSTHWPRIIRLLEQYGRKLSESFTAINAERIRIRPLPGKS